jgi:hypothetical protein
MKSASQMSLEIRRKKKAMQDDPQVVDLSGIPMDKTDEDVMDRDAMTTDLGLDTNKPKAHSEAPDDMVDASEPPSPEVNMPSDSQSKRKLRLSKLMSR